MKNCYKWALIFTFIHVILLVPHISGVSSISVHEGTIYGFFMTFVEIPGILIVNVFNLDSEWLIFVFNALIYGSIGFLIGKLLDRLCKQKNGVSP